jgi:hypothetical protein
MSIEAMKQALEAVEAWEASSVTAYYKLKALDPVLRQAIAEAEKQETVGYVYSVSGEKIKSAAIKKEVPNGTPLYTHPQQTQPKAEKQEPVAQIYVKNGYWIDTPNANVKDLDDGWHTLYTHPQPAQPKREPLAYAGVTIWGGDATVTKRFTRIQIEQARNPRALVEFAIQECLNELAIHGIKER